MHLFWFYLSPDELNFWGGIIGSALGGFLAIVGTFFGALYAAKKAVEQARLNALQQTNKEKHDVEIKKIEGYQQAIMYAEVSLQSLITQAYSNERIFNGCVESLQTGGVLVSKPRPYVFNRDLIYEFKNLELVNKWLRLSMQANQVNSMLEDFNSFYSYTSETVHRRLLTSPTSSNFQELVNAQVISQDRETLAGFAGVNIEATKTLLIELIDMLALISVHAKKPNGHFKVLADLNAFSVTLQDFEAEKVELSERFKPATMFTDIGSNLPSHE